MALKEVLACLVLTTTAVLAKLPCPCQVVTFDDSSHIKALCPNKDLTEVPSCVPNGTTTLDFAGNIVHELGVGLTACLPALRDLFASRCHVANVSADAFSRTPQLRQLLLAHNSIHQLPPGVFDATPLLEVVNLASNMLSSLPSGLFKRVTNLKRLELTSNYLSTLPGELLGGCGEPARLRFGTNHLTTVPAALINSCRSMTELDASANKMKVLLPDVVAAIGQLPGLNSLHLHDNPWHCDCALSPLTELLRTHDALERQLTCGSPPDERDLHVVRVVSGMDCAPLARNSHAAVFGHAPHSSRPPATTAVSATTVAVVAGVATCTLAAAAAFFTIRRRRTKSVDRFNLLVNQNA